MFDTEDYERSKPAAFLGSTKKRVDEADARAAGLEKRRRLGFSAAAAWQYLGRTRRGVTRVPGVASLGVTRVPRGHGSRAGEQ